MSWQAHTLRRLFESVPASLRMKYYAPLIGVLRNGAPMTKRSAQKMDIVDLPWVEELPDPEDPPQGKSWIVLYVDFLLNRLVEASPADLISESLQGHEPIPWRLRRPLDREETNIVMTDTRLYRPILGRIGASYLPGSLYGGHRRFCLRRSGEKYSAAFFLGNDSQTGLWFRGRCVPISESSGSNHFAADPGQDFKPDHASS